MKNDFDRYRGIPQHALKDLYENAKNAGHEDVYVCYHNGQLVYERPHSRLIPCYPIIKTSTSMGEEVYILLEGVLV